jgi:adenylate cyclase
MTIGTPARFLLGFWLRIGGASGATWLTGVSGWAPNQGLMSEAMSEPHKPNLTDQERHSLDPSLVALRDALADLIPDPEAALGYRIVDPEREAGGKSLALEEVRAMVEKSSGSMPLLRDLWLERDRWGMDLEIIQKLSGMALELGELGLVYEIGGKGLELDPNNPRLAQQVALAHVHDGHHERAREVIAPISGAGLLEQLEPVEREEVLAVMGRIHKEIFRQTCDRTDLDRACESYRRAFEEGEGGSYPRINEASLRFIGGQVDEARRLAEEVIGLVGEPADAWAHATRAEALLVLGDLAGSCESYRRALAENPSWRAAARMREQALWIVEGCAAEGGAAFVAGAPEQLREAFAELPSIVIYGGLMFGDSDLPEAALAMLGERLAATLRQINPAVLYGSAKCGADLMILEAAGEGVERQILLPGPEQEFVAAAVVPGGDRWLGRFEAQVTRPASELLPISRHDPGENDVAQAYVQEVMIGLASLRARRLGLDTRALILWDPASARGGGDPSTLISRLREAGIPVELISLRDKTLGLPAPLAKFPSVSSKRPGLGTRSRGQEIKAMLFADVEGFSQLGEEQILPFQNRYMRVVSAIIDEGGPGPVVANTWGDAIYMVFDRVLDAAQFALQMKERLSSFDRHTVGLPDELAIRTALHAGPVFSLVDPVTRFFTYTGSHVTYTARLEPVTEPGQIYVSEQFAALLELAPGRDELALFYVGHRPAAKGYGEVSLYRLERG